MATIKSLALVLMFLINYSCTRTLNELRNNCEEEAYRLGWKYVGKISRELSGTNVIHVVIEKSEKNTRVDIDLLFENKMLSKKWESLKVNLEPPCLQRHNEKIEYLINTTFNKSNKGGEYYITEGKANIEAMIKRKNLDPKINVVEVFWFAAVN